MSDQSAHNPAAENAECGDAIADCPTRGGEGVIYPAAKSAGTPVRSSGEPVDLLAALQRSLDAAKASGNRSTPGTPNADG